MININKKSITLPTWMMDAAHNIDLLKNTTVKAHHITTELLLPQEKIFLVSHPMDYNVPQHQHDYYELVFVDHGRVKNIMQDTEQYLLPGSLLIMNLSSHHALKAIDKKATVTNICLQKDLFDDGIFHDFIMADNPVANFLRNESEQDFLYFSCPQNMRLRTTLNDILTNYQASGFHMSFALAANVLLLLSLLTDEQQYTYVGIYERCLDILDYIQQNPIITLSQLAAHFGFNPNYLSRYIHQHTGATTSQLIIKSRLNFACQRLLYTDDSIENIALSTGWRSISHFYRTFKSQLSMTPENFRQQFSRP